MLFEFCGGVVIRVQIKGFLRNLTEKEEEIINTSGIKKTNISIIIIGCIIPIFISVSLIYFYIMLSSLKLKDKNLYQMENDDEKWIYGFIYYNKEDPKFLVEKRLGVGWNINMATTKGKVFTILILVMTVGSLILPFI